MGSGDLNERASKIWIKLCTAKENYGKESPEYGRELKEWIKFLRSEARAVKKRGQECMDEFKEAYHEFLTIKELHGEDSPEYIAAKKKFCAAEDKATKAIDEIEPIFRSAMSL